MPRRAESAGFLCRNAESSCNSEGVGRLTGTRGSGFLALLTQFGHLSQRPSWKTDALRFPDPGKAWLCADRWGSPSQGTSPGDLAVLGTPTWQQEKAQRKNTGHPMPWAPPQAAVWSPLRHLGLGTEGVHRACPGNLGALQTPSLGRGRIGPTPEWPNGGTTLLIVGMLEHR